MVVNLDSLIESIPGVYGGRPRLARAGFPIIQLVADYRSGFRVRDFLREYPHIDEASVYAGIAYYLANKEALDAELDERNAEGQRMKAEWEAEQRLREATAAKTG
jgi:uncharacterized protein (DUF433 family)